MSACIGSLTRCMISYFDGLKSKITHPVFEAKSSERHIYSSSQNMRRLSSLRDQHLVPGAWNVGSHTHSPP